MTLPRAALVVVLFVVPASAGPVAAPADLSTAETGGVTAPAWNHDLLRDCQGDCSWAYATAPWEFNVCYACFCLVRSAETAGELESAISQCRFELARPR